MPKKRRRDTRQDLVKISHAPQMRDVLDIARTSRVRRFGVDFSNRTLVRTLSNLAVEDLRRRDHENISNTHPTYKLQDGTPAQIERREVHSDKMRLEGMSASVRDAFHDAHRVMVCRRRKARRRVIFALQRAGKGGKRNRRARWTDKSRIVCK